MTAQPSSWAVLYDIRSRTFRSLALAALFAFSALGCGQESKIDRKPIFGKIVGAEGKNGVVIFTPIDTTIGPAVTRSFKDGAYRFGENNGPVPGEYNVSIKLVAPPSSSAPAQKGRGGGRGARKQKLVGREPSEGGRVAYQPPKTTKASVPADGPFEIDLDLTKVASQ